MKSLFKLKKSTITVLQIDNDRLNIIQAEPLGKDRKISRIITENITSLSNNAIVAIIARLSKELNINSNFLMVSVPYYLVAVRNLEFPSTDSAEIKNIIELQVGKQTPFSKDEIVYDYQVLSANQEGYSEVMSVIVQRKVIERYFELLKKAGLKTERVALSSEGLLGWSRFAYKQKIDDKPFILIELGQASSDFEVILENKLIYSRNISLGFLQSKENSSEWQEKFIGEVKNSIYAYQNEVSNKEAGQIVISGVESLTAALNRDILRDKFGLAVEIIDSVKNIPLAKEALDLYKSKTVNTSISALLGLALMYPEQQINFIPQELRLEKEVKEKGRELYLLGIYLVFILAIISSVFLGRIYNKQRYLSRLKQEIFAGREEVGRLDKMMKEMEAIEVRSAAKGVSLKFIYETHKAVSPDIHLLSVNFDGKDHLTLRGTSKTMSEIFSFINALEESGCFQNVKTKYATKRKVKGREMADFEIICPLTAELQQRLIQIDEK